MTRYRIADDETGETLSKGDTIGGLSDGYHTFDELYEHRIELWIALCSSMNRLASRDNDDPFPAWRSRWHSDDTSIGGWFLLGLDTREGRQMTYHLPLSYWDRTDFAQTLDKAPPFDGHTSADVLERLRQL